MTIHSGAYRRVTEAEAIRLQGEGENVEWAEGCGHIVYDQQALEETQAQADQLAKAHGHDKRSRPLSVLNEITAERQRQIAKGYDAAHDDEHLPDEIATAAASYAIGSDSMYPWGSLPEGSRREHMVIAAALLVAAIERLDRESKP